DDVGNDGTAGISVGIVSSMSITGGVRYMIPVTATASGTLILTIGATGSISDGAGNALTLPVQDNDTIQVTDSIPPTVASIVRSSPTNAITNVANVQFAVTFSEPVSGVDASDFVLTTTGVFGANVTNVSGSGASYTVTVFTGSGDGTIHLD